VPLVLSEIDPVQNKAVNFAVGTPGFSETTVWSGQPGGCGNVASATYGTCYPPAVNYDPRYYLVNGVAFKPDRPSRVAIFRDRSCHDRPHPRTVRERGPAHARSSIVGAQTGTPTVSGFGLIAEDGNVLPGLTRVQSEVFLAAGKTYDVLVTAPAAGAILPGLTAS